jgi:putative DNA primase/helicase
MPIQEWLLTLRRKNISVLLIHHAGKNGNQRGNSKKEDLLDTVVALKKPSKHDPSEGARFEIHYEKARGFHGDDAKAFEASIRQEENKITWLVKEIENVLFDQALELKEQGYTQRDIAADLNISLSSVNRLLKKSQGEA